MFRMFWRILRLISSAVLAPPEIRAEMWAVDQHFLVHRIIENKDRFASGAWMCLKVSGLLDTATLLFLVTHAPQRTVVMQCWGRLQRRGLSNQTLGELILTSPWSEVVKDAWVTLRSRPKYSLHDHHDLLQQLAMRAPLPSIRNTITIWLKTDLQPR